jgi:CBS domain-containing protein
MTNRAMHEIIVRRAPVALPPAATVHEACCAMRDHRIGAVLVTDPGTGRLLGIFTGRDAICRMLAEGRDPRATPLSEVMTRSPETLGPRHRAIEALRLMRDGGFRHMPVVEEGGRLLGIVSRGDFQGGEQSRLEGESHLWERM